APGGFGPHVAALAGSGSARPPATSTVGVARTPSGNVLRPLAPARSRRPLNTHPGDHAMSDARCDSCQQLPLQQAQLCGPGGGTGTNGQFTVVQRHGLRMLGDLRPHERRPLAEDPAVRQSRAPPQLGRHVRQQASERLWVTFVEAGPRPTASPWILPTVFQPTRTRGAGPTRTRPRATGPGAFLRGL